MMKENILKIWKVKKFKLAVKTFLVFFISSLIIIILKFPSLPPEVPLYYSLPWGEEQLTSPLNLTILPLSSLFAFLINFYLAGVFFEEEPWLSRLLILTGTAFSFLSLFTLIKIIFLIT